MATLLHIEASPTKDRSYSLRTAKAFLDAYRKAHPGDTLLTVDVFDGTLTEFGAAEVTAKYKILHGKSYTPTDAFVWKNVEATIAAFRGADKYVLSSAMWNFGIPYMLKKYFDVLVQPGYTFEYSNANGYTGLVTGKPIMLVLARGGEYAQGTPGAAYDFQRPYLETILRFIGFTDIQAIIVEPTLAKGPEAAAKVLEKAVAEAKKLGKTF